MQMSPAGLRRYRAERLLRKGFPELRAKVLTVVRSQLRGKGITLDPADLEACYAQAWQGLYATVLGGKQVENPSAWLVLVTFRRAIDESRAASRAGVVGGGEMGACPSRFDAHAPDLAGELDDRTRLRQVFEAMRATLSVRECEAASLCYLQGLSRAEAATQIGVSEARMRKLMEGAGPGRPGVAAKVGELLDTIKGGGWCEQQSSLMRAYAFGILDPDGERHTLAVAHCRECPACRAHVASLRGLASVLPPLPLLSRLALASGTGTTAGASAAGMGSGTGVEASAGTGAAGTATAGIVGTSFGARTSAGVTGAGWSPFAVSLAAKLAVAGLVVLGAGYAVLGSLAHGSPPNRHVGLAPHSAADEALPRSQLTAGSHLVTRGARAVSGGRYPARRSSVRPVHSPRNRSSAREVAAREFGPERVLSKGAPPARSTVAGPEHPTGGASDEFSFE
jgi:DNA-directed RNA polymerase specialized sigma24 family protein